jgi:GNAT superfamily N-acetyltransferase
MHLDAMTDIQIQPATEADVPLMLELIKALAEYERLADHVTATEAMIRDSFFGPSPHAQAVIARVAGDAVGFAIWFSTYSTFLSKPGIYLEDLFVLPHWRGQGVGRALLRHLARIAVERGCGRVEWSVLDWNETAIGFYRNLGARAMDEWTVYRLTGDAITALADS